MRTIAIHPAGLAELNVTNAGKKYRPSNGTEGAIFHEAWCCQCARDKSLREGADIDECDDREVCGIIYLTYAHDVDHPEYPTEWQYGPDGQPRCTAFVPAGQPIPVIDEHTIDMFNDGIAKVQP